MNTLRLSGKDLLRFLLNHYDFVQLAFNESKPEFILQPTQLSFLLDQYNSLSETKLNISRLAELKFCRQLSTGEYKLNSNYTSFLEFIFDDFVLDLPETLKSRYQAISNNFQILQVTSSEERLIVLILEILKVIDSFLMDIDGQTIRLLKDTESLKINSENHDDLSYRIAKASYWIDEYIIPLNTILDKDHPGSLVSAIMQVQRYSSEMRILSQSYTLRTEFEKLYACCISAKNELDTTIVKITRELLPLLERIKSDSIILSGFYHFVENIDRPEQYIIPLPKLIRKSKESVISKTFYSEAEFYIDQFNYKPPEILYEEQAEQMEWLPDASLFKEELIKQGGVDDFYQWCLDQLKKYPAATTLSNYFTISNLLLDEDLLAEYTEEDRFDVVLNDAILKVPKVKVYEKLPTGSS
jgi:hypothetical protein